MKRDLNCAPYEALTFPIGPTTGIDLRLFAILAPNGGVTADIAVRSIKAGTAFFVIFPSSPPIWEPAQSPVPLKTPSFLILANSFFGVLDLLTVFLRAIIILVSLPDIS